MAAREANIGDADISFFFLLSTRSQGARPDCVSKGKRSHLYEFNFKKRPSSRKKSRTESDDDEDYDEAKSARNTNKLRAEEDVPQDQHSS